MRENFGRPWHGALPKRTDELLPEGFAVLAKNCRVDSQAITPIRGTQFAAAPNPGAVAPATVQTIYLYEGAYWLNWTGDVDVAKGPVVDDVRKRLYWTGDGAYPKKGELSQIVGGGGPLPAGSWKMGVPAPATKPTLAVQAAGSSTLQEDRAYVYTYVSEWGEESAPSPPAIITDVLIDDTIRVSALAAAPGSPYNTVGGNIRIYRTKRGSDPSLFNAYLFVAEVAITATQYDDAVAADALGEVIPSYRIEQGTTITWDEPPNNLKGLIAFPGGGLVGFDLNTVYFSEPGFPHAWPAAYARNVAYDIVGIGVTESHVIVLTEGYPYVLSGVHPLVMTQERLPISQPCVAKRSVLEVQSGVAYASPDGIYLIGPGLATLLTKEVFTRDQWQAFVPSSMHAAIHDGRAFFWYETLAGEQGALVIDPAGAERFLTETDVFATAAFSETSQDALYLVVGGNIVQWDADLTTNLQYIYESLPKRTPPWGPGGGAVFADYSTVLTGAELAAYQAAQAAIIAANAALELGAGALNGAAIDTYEINGDGYADPPVIPSHALAFEYLADGAVRHTELVLSDEPFPITDGGPARLHAVRLTGDLTVWLASLGTQKGELG